MKKQDMIKLAIVGMMVGATTLGAQGANQPAPNGSCNSVIPPAVNGNGTTQQAPKGSCGNKPNPDNTQVSPSSKKRGVDTSIRSSYSNSNQQKASKNRAYDQKCGANSCNDDASVPPQPQPGTGSAKVTTKRSSVK